MTRIDLKWSKNWCSKFSAFMVLKIEASFCYSKQASPCDSKPVTVFASRFRENVAYLGVGSTILKIFIEVRFVVKSGGVANIRNCFNFVRSNSFSGNRTLKTRKCTVSACMYICRFVFPRRYSVWSSRKRNAPVHRN